MTGLRIAKNTPLGVGLQAAHDIKEQWSTEAHVEAKIKSKGIQDFKQPSFECPFLTPQNFNLSDAKACAETYLSLNAWYSFIAELLAKVNLSILEYENMLEHLEAKTREEYRTISQPGKKMTQLEIADRILLNPQHMQLTKELQKYKQYKERLSTRADALSRSLRVLSRQIEIRRQDLEHTAVPNRIPFQEGKIRGRFNGGY